MDVQSSLLIGGRATLEVTAASVFFLLSSAACVLSITNHAHARRTPSDDVEIDKLTHIVEVDDSQLRGKSNLPPLIWRIDTAHTLGPFESADHARQFRDDGTTIFDEEQIAISTDRREQSCSGRDAKMVAEVSQISLDDIQQTIRIQTCQL